MSQVPSPPPMLVHHVAEAIYGGAAYGAPTKKKAERATVAALREVADALFEELLSRVEPGMVVRPADIPNLLRSWADAIDKDISAPR